MQIAIDNVQLLGINATQICKTQVASLPLTINPTGSLKIGMFKIAILNAETEYDGIRHFTSGKISVFEFRIHKLAVVEYC